MALFDRFRQDLLFTLRQFRRAPAFTVTAILVLALGLCASIAIFAFVDAALLKSLPYRDAARLLGVYERIPLCERCNLSYYDYLDWKRMNKTLASLDMYTTRGFILNTPTGAERAPGVRVSAGFFKTLGVTPLLGRDFAASEDQPSAAKVTILSYSAWQSRYGARRDIVGQSVALGGEPYTIIGVLPADFHFAPVGTADFWTPHHQEHGCEDRRGCHNLYGVGRLKDGVSMESAAADFALVARQLEAQYPDSNRGQGSNIVPLTEVIVGRVRPVLITLLAGSGLLLLIAAVNVANLLLVRSEGRRHEIAVRSSLGASPARLAAQFVTESAMLVIAGAAVGLGAASWLAKVLVGVIPQAMLSGMPYLRGLGLHSREWVFAGGVSLLAAILFSLTPLVRLSFSDARAAINESGRGHSGFVWRRLGSQLVMLELATAVVLLVGAGLLGKSLYRVLQVDLGMRADHLATVQVATPISYSKEAQFVAVHREILRRVAAIPGIESAATVSVLPVIGGNTRWIRFADRPFYGEHNEVAQRFITPNYFATLGAHLAEGRYFTGSDDASHPLVAIIDRALAQKYYPGKDPLGQQIFYIDPPSKPITIVGMVDDIQEGAIDSNTWPTMYTPFDQNPSGFFIVVARTAVNDYAALPGISAAIHRLDPGLMTGNPHTMSDQVANSPAAYLRRVSATLTAGFAVFALILGVIGLYGVVAYSVSQRTREIGVRIALGARPAAVYRLILKEAAILVAAGVTLGLLFSAGAGALIQSLLFGIRAWDAATFASVAAVLAIAALAASFLPARRAASVNPVDALRSE